MSPQSCKGFDLQDDHAGASQFLKRLLTGISDATQLVDREFAAWCAQRELLGLPDGMLSDLGISRSEVSSLVRQGRSDLARLPLGRT